MSNESKIRLARWISIPVVILGLRFMGGGKGWDYLVDHVWLAVVLPFVGLFVLLFWRGMYIHSRRAREDDLKIGSARSAKP
jgi:hypothetical protein